MKIWSSFKKFWGHFIDLLVGVPHYEAYLEHMASAHPDQKSMSRDEFYRETLERKYGKNSSRCC